MIYLIGDIAEFKKNDKDKGVVLINKNMKDLSGLINFNRI
jgi:hypothetical protein